MKKFDRKKTNFSLIPAKGLKVVASVMEHGAAKYGEGNWREGDFKENISRLHKALSRHSIACWEEVDHEDEDSGELSIAHIAANCLLILSLIEENKGTKE